MSRLYHEPSPSPSSTYYSEADIAAFNRAYDQRRDHISGVGE